MNENIEYLKAAGLIEYWYSLAFSKQFSKQMSDPPKVLSLDHLSGCFQIWMIGCLVSFLVFTYELIINKYKNRLSRRQMSNDSNQ